MTIFSFFLIGILLFPLLMWKNINKIYRYYFIITTSCFLNVKMGYFIKVGSNEISYSPFLVYITAILGTIIYIKYNKKIDKKLFYGLLCLIMMIFLNYISFLIFRYPEQVFIGSWDSYVRGIVTYKKLTTHSIGIGYYLLILGSALMVVFGTGLFSNEDWQFILNKVIDISKISIIVGWIEYFIVNFFRSKIITDLCILIFGQSGVQQNYLFSRGGIYISQGMTKEPSMFTTTLFYLALLFLIQKKCCNQSFKWKRKSKKWFIACVLLIIADISMSSLVYLIVLYLFCQNYEILKDKKKPDKKFFRYTTMLIIGLGIAIGIFLALNYQMLVDSKTYIIRRMGLAFQQLLIISGSIAGKITPSSESSRLSGIFYNLKMLSQKPIMGFGVGTLSCMSGIVIMLNNLGCVGFVLWIYSWIKMTSVFRIKSQEVIFSIFIIVLPNIILNDYNTILCLVIPLLQIIYSRYLNKKILYGGKCDKEVKKI